MLARAPAVARKQRHADRRDQDAVGPGHPIAPLLIGVQRDVAHNGTGTDCLLMPWLGAKGYLPVTEVLLKKP